MAIKPFVRIIKRNERANEQTAAARNAEPKRPKADSSARATKAAVSTWVKEFQQRSRIDAKLAFHNLFKDPLPRPSET